MKNIFRSLLVIFSLLIFAGCEGPFVFMSGGALTGTVGEVPATWQLPEASAMAQLETRPEDPYSINLVYVQLNNNLYVYAGDTRTNWVKHIEENPLVRIRIGETIYQTRAVRIENREEITEFAAFWASRSMFQRDPMQFEEVWLYQLVAP